jgi:F-type H+-transporting ATPase subunit b
MKIVETIALITINETLIFQLFSFLLFLFILNRIMIRPLRRVMGEREDLLGRISQDISATQQAFVDIGHQIESQENAARREAFTLREEIEASGKHSAETVLAKTREQINVLKAKSKEATTAQLAAARREIEKEAQTISEQMIASLLGRRSAP